MKKLDSVRFERARDYLLKQARPLEKAVFAYEFEGGAVTDVLSELKKFQNPDGGFGNALEPDLRTPGSSALCTEMGLRYLAEWHLPAEYPMVRAAVQYLQDAFDPQSQLWRVVPVDANEHPHAPWWHDKDGSLARTFDDFLVIPRAGILASLYHYAELVPAGWLSSVTERTVQSIKSLEIEKFGGGGDTLTYALRLAEAPGLPAETKDWLTSRVIEVAGQIVARDPAQWTEYCAPPLKLAPTPRVITAGVLKDSLPRHLDYLVDQQSAEGYWDVTWSWGDFYPDVWPQAKEEWRGILTLDNLIALRAFDRLEDVSPQ